VRRVRGGEEVLVTDRGEVVATLLPPAAVRAAHDLEPGVRRLVAQGRLVPGRGNDRALYPAFPALVPAGTAAAWIAEDREER
jgi:antitoxin (DNA-binding transcriptional repressor) of toxin-antitoxin stability system